MDRAPWLKAGRKFVFLNEAGEICEVCGNPTPESPVWTTADCSINLQCSTAALSSSLVSAVCV